MLPPYRIERLDRRGFHHCHFTHHVDEAHAVRDVGCENRRHDMAAARVDIRKRHASITGGVGKEFFGDRLQRPIHIKLSHAGRTNISSTSFIRQVVSDSSHYFIFGERNTVRLSQSNERPTRASPLYLQFRMFSSNCSTSAFLSAVRGSRGRRGGPP